MGFRADVRTSLPNLARAHWGIPRLHDRMSVVACFGLGESRTARKLNDLNRLLGCMDLSLFNEAEEDDVASTERTSSLLVRS